MRVLSQKKCHEEKKQNCRFLFPLSPPPLWPALMHSCMFQIGNDGAQWSTVHSKHGLGLLERDMVFMTGEVREK